MAKKRILILVSGRGSNMESILSAIERGEIGGEAVGVISSSPEAPAIDKCRARGLSYTVVDRKDCVDNASFQAELCSAALGYTPDLICLAGFMHILGSSFLSRFPGKVMNIHPSLLPSFPGLHAHEQAIRYGVRFSGCTVHFVDDGMDTGPIILQQPVPVLPTDDADALAARILVEEHRLYPEAVGLFCAERLKINGRHVLIGEQGGKVNG